MTSTVVHLNVGGTIYTTSVETLGSQEKSLLAQWFPSSAELGACALPKDSSGRYFIDRDGLLFRYILDFLRDGKIVLPDGFQERRRLKAEATFYQLSQLESILSDKRHGCITVGYQGSFYFGRQGMGADVSFRKISRILVSGKVTLCREIFGESLNEGRDPDRGHEEDRYTSRFFLKHNSLEQAFDNLALSGFKMVGCSASGTSSAPVEPGVKPGSGSTEEERWAHYNEFVFIRV